MPRRFKMSKREIEMIASSLRWQYIAEDGTNQNERRYLFQVFLVKIDGFFLSFHLSFPECILFYCFVLVVHGSEVVT